LQAHDAREDALLSFAVAQGRKPTDEDVGLLDREHGRSL
jgi:hypothetical protein